MIYQWDEYRELRSIFKGTKKKKQLILKEKKGNKSPQTLYTMHALGTKKSQQKCILGLHVMAYISENNIERDGSLST